MIVAIHQPQFMPWLGYFDKIDKADVFCFLDDVQYKKNEWQNRNRLKTAQGTQWLTVPVRYRFPQKIHEVAINNKENWRRKHLQALSTNYRKAPCFRAYFEIFEDIYAREWRNLTDLNIFATTQLMAALGLGQTQTVRASELTKSQEPTQRLIDICRLSGGDVYLSGRDGALYMDMDRFQGSGVDVVFQDFHHPSYTQLYGDFVSHLSVVDLLFCCGSGSLEIIRSQNPPIGR
ncbi:hypothetical protein D3OALGA1CA_3660 [Olavius algarvensis associated proteobacterium Delta 3]|nr:hypothetical protein D3OALGA1CA_3660 [Olavius algarvensis associated proteobacterium Delta 3]CAB5147889.1 hypothetical protein D3OALGB2SA_4621 [Olavius algarvensis associated proteobacterium Delta 3]